MKILIASYHFPPFNVAASQRALGWAKYLPEFGIQTTLVTMDFKGVKPVCSADVHYIKQVQGLTQEDSPFFAEWPIVSTAKTVKNYLIGHFDQHIQSAERALWNWLDDHCSAHTYDLYLGIFSPHFHIEHGYRLKKKYGLPFVIDFRDLFDNRLADGPIQASRKQELINTLILTKWKKWMQTASGWSTVSIPLAVKLHEWFESEGRCILNGVDVKEMQATKIKHFEKFTVIHTGRIYEDQDLKTFLSTWQKFEQGRDVELLFYGENALLNKHLCNFMSDYGLLHKVKILPKAERPEILALQKGAHLLYFPGFINRKGLYSTKIFEYVASQSHVLLCPSDKDVIDQLLSKYEGTHIMHTEEQASVFLEDHYRRWQQNQLTPINRQLKEIDRRYMAGELATYLKEIKGEMSI